MFSGSPLSFHRGISSFWIKKHQIIRGEEPKSHVFIGIPAEDRPCKLFVFSSSFRSAVLGMGTYKRSSITYCLELSLILSLCEDRHVLGNTWQHSPSADHFIYRFLMFISFLKLLSKPYLTCSLLCVLHERMEEVLEQEGMMVLLEWVTAWV